MSIVLENVIKRLIKEKKPVAGTMLVEIRQTSIVQFLANAGFQFVIIDGEHSPFNIETVAELSRNARNVGLSPIVRISDMTYTQITQPLDAGAQGIMVPRITNAQQVRDVVKMMKYPPIGIRGNAMTRGYTNFRSGDVVEVMKAANQETLLMVQIETKEAIENLEEILSVPHVDVAFVGPNDLSIALGVPGQQKSELLIKTIEKVIESCNRHNVCPAIHANDTENAVLWASKGMRLVSAGTELRHMISAGQQMMSQILKAWSKM